MIIHGKDILIMTSGGGALIAAAKSCDIYIKVNTQEVSSPTTGVWKTYITKRKEWSVSLSHLVTMGQFPACLTTVGTQLTLKMGVRTPTGTDAPFDGMIWGVESAEFTRDPVDTIIWEVGYSRFVAGILRNEEYTYYRSWAGGEAYTHPSSDIPYTYDGKTYMWTPDGELIKLARLTGSAIITNAKVTATNGNLAQGSWSLQGTGALTTEDM